jgi:hypothetical protein
MTSFTNNQLQNWKIGFSFLSIAVCLFSAFIAPQGVYFWPNFLAYAFGILIAPMIAFFVTYPRIQVATGMLIAFSLTFCFDYIYETHLHKGSNSLPFVVYFLFCLPLCLMGSLIGNAISKRMISKRPIKQVVLIAILGTLFGSSPILLALLKY